MHTQLLLLGANNPETIRLIRAINVTMSRTSQDSYDILGWLDNDPARHGEVYCGLSILGSPEVLALHEYRQCKVVNNITRDGCVRRETCRQLMKYGLPFAKLLHPSVNLEDVQVGEGVILHEGALVQAGAVIEDHACLAGGCIVSHEAHVGPCVFISSGATVSGQVSIGEAATIWAGAVIAPRIRIGAGAVVGIGSVVVNDVPDNATVFGNPARILATAKKR